MLQPPRHDQHSAPSSTEGTGAGTGDGGQASGACVLRVSRRPPGDPNEPHVRPSPAGTQASSSSCRGGDLREHGLHTQALRQPCIYFPPTAGWEEASTDTRRRHRHGARPQPAREQKRQGQTHHTPSHSRAVTANPHGHLPTPLSCAFYTDQLHGTREPHAAMGAVGKPRAPPVSAAWVPTHALSAVPASLLGPLRPAGECTEPRPSEVTLPQAAPGQAQATAQAAGWRPRVTEVLTGLPLPASVVCRAAVLEPGARTRGCPCCGSRVRAPRQAGR